jgi:sulfite reductase alpha subunit-like flavoprotein
MFRLISEQTQLWFSSVEHVIDEFWLAYDGTGQASVPVFLQESAHFRPPKDAAAPMIMDGPGTGIAPFRAFLQDRQAEEASGRNWLFFGEQRTATDFYYRDELKAIQGGGTLHRLDTAFSRDQSEQGLRAAPHGRAGRRTVSVATTSSPSRSSWCACSDG